MDTTPPTEVISLAERCINLVEQTTKMRLDFAAETLPILDHYVRTLRKELAGQPMDRIVAAAAPIGAYLGEVARRLIPLQWFAPPDDHRRWRIELEDAFLSLNPVGAALEALLLAEASGWGADFRVRPEDRPAAAASLANLPQVELDEYYSPSNRVEVLTIVADALINKSLADGMATSVYGPADYGALRVEAIDDALEADPESNADDAN